MRPFVVCIRAIFVPSRGIHGLQLQRLRTALAATRESRGHLEAFSRIGVVSETEARLAALEAAQQGGGDHDPDTGRR